MRSFIEPVESRLLRANIAISGTNSADNIQLTISGVYVNATVNGVTTQYSAVRQITISGNDGNDSIIINQSISVPQTLTGGSGSDTLTGGSGVDSIDGGSGNDIIHDYGINSTLKGGSGDDFLRIGYDAHGTEYMYGGDGADQLIVFSDGTTGTVYRYQNNSSNTPDGDADTTADYTDGGLTIQDFLVSSEGDHWTPIS